MSAYEPPTQILPIFDVDNFIPDDDNPLTLGEAERIFVKNTNAIVNGSLSVGGTTTLLGTLSIPTYPDVSQELTNINNDIDTLIIDLSGISYNPVTDTTTIDNSLNVVGTFSIPSYPDVSSHLTEVDASLNNIETRITGITYTSGTDTTTIDNSLNITGTFSIPSYPNVSSHLTLVDASLNNIETRITGISYDAPTDKTIIDNSLNVVGQSVFLSPVGIGQTPLSPYMLDVRNLATNDTRLMINDCSLCTTNTNASLNLFIRENLTKEHIHMRRAFTTGGGLQVKDFGMSVDDDGSLTMGKYDNAGNYEELLYVNENHTIDVDGDEGGDYRIVKTGGNITLSGTAAKVVDISYNPTTDTTLVDGSLNVIGTLSIPSYPNVSTTLNNYGNSINTLNGITTGITYTTGTDLTTIDNSLNVVGTFSIPSYPNVETTLTNYNNSINNLNGITTGITYTTGTDLTTIDNSLNVVGTFSIPSYPNVETTLTNYNNSINNLNGITTGITYTSGTDLTTIDNSLNITGTLSIPSFTNVSTTLTGINSSISTLNTNATGITYDLATDTTTIDNSFNITGANSSILKLVVGNSNSIAPTTATNRGFNVCDTGGGIKLVRNNDSAAPFIELESWNAAFNTLNNRVFLGGGTPTDERFIVRFGTTPTTDVLTIRTTGTNLITNLDVSGNYTSTNGNITLTNGTVTATTFSGTATNANNILATSDNTSGNYYIPFIKTSGTGNKALFIDDTTTPITINPNTGDIRMIGLKNDFTNSNVAFGKNAGGGQGTNTSCVAIGTSTGETNQGTNAVALGNITGQTNQGTSGVAIGNESGNSGQGSFAVGLGYRSGKTSQGGSALAIGPEAGATSQGQFSVGIGQEAGQNNQATRSVAIGYLAGKTSQGNDCVAIGQGAGLLSQGAESVAIGSNTGRLLAQGARSVIIGGEACRNGQLTDAVAIGYAAGKGTENSSATRQGQYAVAIGRQAGEFTQGARAIAIGYLAGQSSQTAGSIVLNASGTALNGNQTGIFIDPVRGVDLKIGIGNVFYNSTTKELQYSTTNSKTTYNSTTDLTTIDSSLNVVGTLTAGTISGTSTNANNILITSDNTAGTYYIPFAKTSGTGQKPLFIDDTSNIITGLYPLTYNPNSGTITTRSIDTNQTVSNVITTTTAFIDKIEFGDGSVLSSYGQPTNDIDSVSYTSSLSIKTSTYDYHSASNTSTTHTANFIAFGLVKLTEGQTYTGIHWITPTNGITCKVVLYTSGASPTILAQRTTNYTTNATRIQAAAFDNVYTATNTSYAYIGVVSNSNMSLVIFNNGDTNFGRTPVANQFSTIAFFVSHTYANAFPSPYSGTPSATNEKYYLGLY